MNISADRRTRLTLFVTILTLFLVSALLVGIGVTTADYIQSPSGWSRGCARSTH
ncbi:hypothetical protein [Bradyrhizobium sp. RT3b]|uniref:hypothetical protein n=1 Tax=Bradyrhizobium sp. RT3b TaxID=3156334 RepID=UPI00339171E1